MGEYKAATEVAKEIRAILRKTFPKHKISVTSSGQIYLAWTDEGPGEQRVKDVIVKAGIAESVDNPYGDKKPWLRAEYYSLCFDCYNAAERAAELEERERQHRQWDLERKQDQEAVWAASEAKSALIVRPTEPSSRSVDPADEKLAYAAFEELRLRAEANVVFDETAQRRPSWAPPMVLEGELLDLCRKLEYLQPDDPPIARLWATFASPKKSETFVREDCSTHSLPGIQCRGFQLHAGGSRQNVSQLLFEAQRGKSERWQFGPELPTDFPRWSGEWEKLIRQRETLVRIGSSVRADLDRINAEIAALDTKELVREQRNEDRRQWRHRAVELARARVLDFAGAPDAQMRLAGRLCGHCCICWKELTDPISLERGIGPDCYAQLKSSVTATLAWMRLQGASTSAEAVARRARLPLEFVTAVLSESGQAVP